MAVLITVLVLTAIGVIGMRKGSMGLVVTAFVLVGIVVAGADGPIATAVRAAANGLINGGTTAVTSIGDSIGGK